MLGSMGNSSMDNFRESLTTFSDHLLSVSHFGYGCQPSHASGSMMSMLYMLAWLGISVQWILSSHLMNTFLEAHRFDVCLFVIFRPTREFFTHLETSPLPMKGYKFRPILMAVEHWGFFKVPRLLWHGPVLYNGHLRGPVTLTPVAVGQILTPISYTCIHIKWFLQIIVHIMIR